MKKLLVICGMWAFTVVFWGALITGLYFVADHAVSVGGFEHGFCTRFLACLGSTCVILASMMTFVAYHITKCLVANK